MKPHTIISLFVVLLLIFILQFFAPEASQLFFFGSVLVVWLIMLYGIFDKYILNRGNEKLWEEKIKEFEIDDQDIINFLSHKDYWYSISYNDEQLIDYIYLKTIEFIKKNDGVRGFLSFGVNDMSVRVYLSSRSGHLELREVYRNGKELSNIDFTKEQKEKLAKLV